MVSFISKFLFTATVTAPTFLSLGLIGVIKDSTNYFQLWDDMPLIPQHYYKIFFLST